MKELLQEINAKLDALLSAQSKDAISLDALYSPSEAATACSVSEDTIYRARINGHLASVQIGGNCRYWGRDLKTWINAGGRTGRNKGSVMAETRNSATA